MEKVLAELEGQLEQLIAEHARLKKENSVLQERAAGLDGDKRQLETKLELAVSRLQTLLEQLPEE